MDLINKQLTDYAESHTQPETLLLQKINRETHLRTLNPRMLSGHLQGRVLSMLSRMIRPKVILEIGTFTGYSAICLAEGLTKGGKLITLDVNEEIEPMTRTFIQESEYAEAIEFVIEDAKTYIPRLKESLDLVFIDADKEGYADYYELVMPLVREGGYIIADNVLWDGKVIDREEVKSDKDTKAIVEFNKKIYNDPRVINVLFTVRDGLMVMQKIKY